jgi:hypothetical protein
MTSAGLIIRHLAFVGPNVELVKVEFESGLNLLYGASNTGKSFTLKSIDFMLGGTTELPEFPERAGYDTVHLGFSLIGKGDFTLTRSISGGNFLLYDGLLFNVKDRPIVKTLAPTMHTKSKESLPQFLLESLSFSGKRLAKNSDGVTENLGFRDLAAISLVDETSIQSERSPVESDLGPMAKTKERSLFRLLLSGIDDSSIVPTIDEKTFKTSKAVRIEVIEELLLSVNSRLESEYPDIEDLPAQNDRLSATLEKMKVDLDLVNSSINQSLEHKQKVSREISQSLERLEEISIHLERFSKLESIYESDVERLGALEEAGFILSLGSERECSLCGAPPDAQLHKHGIADIAKTKSAAFAEIRKIESQKKELSSTIVDLKTESQFLSKQIPILKGRLDKIEAEIAQLTPRSIEGRNSLNEILVARDQVKQGLNLIGHRDEYKAKLEEVNSLKKPSKDDKPKLKTPDEPVYELCRIISGVLRAWDFPGNCDVAFDEKTCDLKIDGKQRTSNGKGVRAITHSAFKVALLIFCQERNLPHPGFVVLDSPLLTYRDPMKNPSAGELTEDEKALASSSLKRNFFQHLSSISSIGQFIILENIDPPPGIEQLAHVEIFFGNTGQGRYGFFPPKH